MFLHRRQWVIHIYQQSINLKPQELGGFFNSIYPQYLQKEPLIKSDSTIHRGMRFSRGVLLILLYYKANNTAAASTTTTTTTTAGRASGLNILDYIFILGGNEVKMQKVFYMLIILGLENRLDVEGIPII